MRITSLIYFYEVAQIKSISKVSANLHISQPALSHQLLKLERELGVKLLERSNRGVQLTEKGEILYKYSKQIINLYKNLNEDIKIDNYTNKELKIDISSIYANHVISKLAMKFTSIFKDCDISINYSKDNTEKSLLLNNRSDVVIGFNKIEDIDLISKHIGNDKLVLVTKSYISENDLIKMPIAILEDKLNEIKNITAYYKKLNISLKTESIDIIKSYLQNSNSCAIVPISSVEDDIKKGLLLKLPYKEYEYNFDLFITYKKELNSSFRKNIRILELELSYIMANNNIEIAI